MYMYNVCEYHCHSAQQIAEHFNLIAANLENKYNFHIRQYLMELEYYTAQYAFS